MKRQLGALLLAGATLPALTGCGSDDADGASDGPEGSEPTLFINENAEGYSEAIVSGRLLVNDQNCVSLDDALLLAPPGSTVSGKDQLVSVPGYDPVELRSQAQFVGGRATLSRDEFIPGMEDCVEAGATVSDVVGVAPQ